MHERVPRGPLGNERRRYGAQRLDAGRNVGQRIENANQTRDFLLRSVLRARENTGDVLRREMRTKHQEPREMELARSDGVEKLRKATDEPGSGYATECLV